MKTKSLLAGVALATLAFPVSAQERLNDTELRELALVMFEPIPMNPPDLGDNIVSRERVDLVGFWPLTKKAAPAAIRAST